MIEREWISKEEAEKYWPSMKMNEWIDAKIESPPKNGELFLACYEYFTFDRKYERDISLCKWYEENDHMLEGFYNYEHGPYTVNPIYWMKIPEVPND